MNFYPCAAAHNFCCCAMAMLLLLSSFVFMSPAPTFILSVAAKHGFNFSYQKSHSNKISKYLCLRTERPIFVKMPPVFNS